MKKTLTQRLNEVNVEAAELLLKEMKKAQEKQRETAILYISTFADTISKLHVSAEPVDMTDTMAKLMMGGIAAPGPKEGDNVQ